tara:strand:- start:860 stop:1066 length:207 start_codon:yes stop_codon:yes gene_type:complete
LNREYGYSRKLRRIMDRDKDSGGVGVEAGVPHLFFSLSFLSLIYRKESYFLIRIISKILKYKRRMPRG